MSPGEVRWVELPQADGHEQVGRRPAVVLQDDESVPGLPTVLAVPITSARLAGRFGGTLDVQPTEQNGLARPSVVLVFQLRAVDRRRFGAQIGTISYAEPAELHRLIDALLGRGLPEAEAVGAQAPAQ